MSRESKRVELRRKTDRDLVNLVRRELERGLTLADLAATKESALYAQAERVYQTAKAWLPLVSGLNRHQRGELESRLKELRSVLDQVPPARVQRHFANASAS